jgi:hypothetical protein
MRTTLLVASHVFRDSVRDKVLYGVVAFVILLMVTSFLIGQITAGQDVKIIKDLGLAAMSLFGLFIAIFIGIGLVSRERREQNQLTEPGSGKPRHAAVIARSAQSQTPVALEAVPSELGGLEELATHGLYWIAEQRFYFTDFDRHRRVRHVTTAPSRGP